MTLFTLLIVMALERVTTKTKSMHITTLATLYFSKAIPLITKHNDNSSNNANAGMISMLVVAGLPTLGMWLLIVYLPGILVFFLYLLALWICLGCPITRQTYKKYLQAADRKDLEACYLYSQQLGNNQEDLLNFGKQLVLINYEQYVSVIIYFVLLGVPGMVFYSLCGEWLETKRAQTENTLEANIESEEKVLFVLDWLPSRIMAFGFLLVGDFSKALPKWLHSFTEPTQSAYDVMTTVAESSEETEASDRPYLDEPLQKVKLLKRNVIFILMAISVLTMAGIIS